MNLNRAIQLHGRPIEMVPRDGTVVIVSDPDAGAFPMRWNTSGTNGLLPGVRGLWEMLGGGLTWSEDDGAGPTSWAHLDLAEQFGVKIVQ